MAERLDTFDPDDVGLANGHLFGLPFLPGETDVVILPVPWEATVSYRDGTALRPRAVLAASPQLDFYDPLVPDAWKLGPAMLPISTEWEEQNSRIRGKASACINLQEHGALPDNPAVLQLAQAVNGASAQLNEGVYTRALEWLAKGKTVGVLGGDHSTPLGLIQALGSQHPEGFGILQLDAHADLRPGYEGFTYSHASIMHHALQVPQVQQLTQVGIRDVSGGEMAVVAASEGRIRCHSMRSLRSAQFAGARWAEQVAEIVQGLPEKVYISFDIDALDPALCPHTGTPVPDGLRWEEAFYLLEQVVQSGRRIIGFDLCEVAPDPDTHSEWDAIVGARALWRLSLLPPLAARRKPLCPFSLS